MQILLIASCIATHTGTHRGTYPCAGYTKNDILSNHNNTQHNNDIPTGAWACLYVWLIHTHIDGTAHLFLTTRNSIGEYVNHAGRACYRRIGALGMCYQFVFFSLYSLRSVKSRQPISTQMYLSVLWFEPDDPTKRINCVNTKTNWRSHKHRRHTKLRWFFFCSFRDCHRCLCCFCTLKSISDSYMCVCVCVIVISVIGVRTELLFCFDTGDKFATSI